MATDQNSSDKNRPDTDSHSHVGVLLPYFGANGYSLSTFSSPKTIRANLLDKKRTDYRHEFIFNQTILITSVVRRTLCVV